MRVGCDYKPKEINLRPCFHALHRNGKLINVNMILCLIVSINVSNKFTFFFPLKIYVYEERVFNLLKKRVIRKQINKSVLIFFILFSFSIAFADYGKKSFLFFS